MKRFSHDEFSDLESELRRARPEPRQDLLDELVTRAEYVPGAPVPVATVVVRRRPRFALAATFVVVVLVALGSFGGIGYATSSVVHAAKSSGHVVKAVTKNDVKANNGNSGGTWHGNTPPKGDPGSGVLGAWWEHHPLPPWIHQYSRFVVICYPITIFGHTKNHTIVVPRVFLPLFVGPGKPGTLGPCGHS